MKARFKRNFEHNRRQQRGSMASVESQPVMMARPHEPQPAMAVTLIGKRPHDLEIDVDFHRWDTTAILALLSAPFQTVQAYAGFALTSMAIDPNKMNDAINAVIAEAAAELNYRIPKPRFEAGVWLYGENE